MRARAIGPKSLWTLAMAMATHAVAVAKSKLSPASASVLIISVASENLKSLVARRSFAKPTAFGLRSDSGGLVTSLSSWYLRPVTVPYLENMMAICIAPAQPRSGVIVEPGARVLMLRTFDLALKGAANKSAQGIALGAVGIAEGVTRRPRGAGRGSRWARVSRPRPLARPTGLPRSS